MYTDEQFEQLELEERELTEEAILLMLALLVSTRTALEKEIRSFYQKYGKDGVITLQEARKWVSMKDRRRRMTVLFALLLGRFNDLYAELSPAFRSFLSEVIEKEAEFFDVETDKDDILTKPWGVDDAIWDTRLADDVELWNAYVANDLKRSFMRQDNVEDVIEKLLDRFESIENVIRKLAMTESTAIGSLARRQIFKILGIKKYRYYAREDERTCEICGSLHGLVFPTSAYEIGVNASPIHPWCRCWEVPIRD